MRRTTAVLALALLLAASPGVAQEWEAMVDHAREAMEQAHAAIDQARERLGEVNEDELREMSERVILELGERLEHVHRWSMEMAERLADVAREERERAERGPHPGHPEGPGMLGRTLRLTFETPGGPVSILTAMREFEAGGTRHSRASENVEAEHTNESSDESAFEAMGEVMPLDDPGRFLVRFEGTLSHEEHGEEIVHRGGENTHQSGGGNVHFRGSVILGIGESKPIFTSPEMEIHLRLDES